MNAEITHVLDSVADGFASLDRNFCFKYVNRAGAEILRKPAAELTGQSIFDVVLGLGGTAFGSALERAFAEQSPQEVDAYLPPLRGWFHVNVVPSGDTLAVYYRDVTDRKLSEQRLLAQYAVSRTLNAGRPLAETGASLLAAIASNLGWRVGQLWVLDRRTQKLSCAFSWQSDQGDYGRFIEASRALKLARSEGFPGRVWETGVPQWVSDFAREYQLPRAKIAREVMLHSGFAFPVYATGEIVAVAEFLNPEIREPDEELLRTVTAIGHQIGQYLERQWSAEALAESELRKSAILETALDAIVTIDGASRVVEFNPAAEATFGYQREDAIGKSMPELIIPPRYRDAHYAGLQRYLETGKTHMLGQRVELSAVRSDGSEFPVELAITRVPMEGENLFTAYLRDITERKQNELDRARLLARAEGAQRYYQVLTEAVPQQIWTASPDGVLDFVNKVAVEYFGCPAAELLGNGWSRFVHPDDVEECERKLENGSRHRGDVRGGFPLASRGRNLPLASRPRTARRQCGEQQGWSDHKVAWHEYRCS
jgi:two-component system, chemotaxis family, CheB/CheR fusion protein